MLYFWLHLLYFFFFWNLFYFGFCFGLCFWFYFGLVSHAGEGLLED